MGRLPMSRRTPTTKEASPISGTVCSPLGISRKTQNAMRQDHPVPAIADLLSRITSVTTRRRQDLCCTDLAEHLEFDCHLHRDPLDCADAVVFRDDSGRIGLPIHDGGSSYIAIQHCPWCGSRLLKQPVARPSTSGRQHVHEVSCRVHSPEQLRQILDRVSDWNGSDFAEIDWRSFLGRMEGADADQEFKYPMGGWFDLTAYVARPPDAGHSRLRFVGEIDDILAARIETLIEVLG